MIKGTDDTRYAYVNGIIRAREARLLTKGHFDRLIAGTMSNFETILSDTSYVMHKDISIGLEAEEIELKEFFDQYCLEDEVRNFVDWPEQVHNIKVRLKEGGDDLMYPQDESAVESWPEVSAEIERFAIDKDPFILSTNLDKILCKYLFETAQFVEFFSFYYQLYFDLENIRSFFRARQFENRKEIFSQVFVPYGSVAQEVFVENLDASYDQLGKSFFTTAYATIMERGGMYIQEHHSFLRLERHCEETRLQFLLQARRMTFGVEPLFAYYQFRMGEIKKIRQVYFGKLNEVRDEELKESIPDVW
jgi:vacuolar-type H+-ATPase subunit C/Vma6